MPVHCAELQDPEEEPDVVPEVDPVEVVEVVVVVRGCGSGSFSQETKNIAVNTVAMSSNFFIPQSNNKYLTIPNFFSKNEQSENEVRMVRHDSVLTHHPN